MLERSSPGTGSVDNPGAFGMPWEVENLTVPQRYAKALEAGIDQFGGVDNSTIIVNLVREGQAP